MFCSKTGSSWLLYVAPLSSLVYYSGVLIGDDDRKTQQIQRMAALDIVVFTLDAFILTVSQRVLS